MPSREKRQGQEFRSKPLWVAWLFLIICLTAFIFILVYGYFDVIYELMQHGIARGISSGYFYGASAVLLFSVISGLMILLLTRKPTRVIVTAEQIYVSRGKEVYTLALNAITQLDLQERVTYYLLIPVHQQQIRISTGNQNIILYSSLRKFSQLADLLSERIYPGIFIRTRQAIQAGQSIEFGEITISRDGIIYQNRFYQWSELKGSWITKEALIIQLAGKNEENIRLLVRKLPNLPVAIRILNEYNRVNIK